MTEGGCHQTDLDKCLRIGKAWFLGLGRFSSYYGTGFLTPLYVIKIKDFYLYYSPTDIEEVPNWFLSNFSIKRQDHIERLVDNPLKNILVAVGKEPPSKQTLLVNSLLDF